MPESGILRGVREAPRLRSRQKIEKRSQPSQPIGPMGRGGWWDNSQAPKPPQGGTLLTPKHRYSVVPDGSLFCKKNAVNRMEIGVNRLLSWWI